MASPEHITARLCRDLDIPKHVLRNVENGTRVALAGRPIVEGVIRGSWGGRILVELGRKNVAPLPPHSLVYVVERGTANA